MDKFQMPIRWIICLGLLVFMTTGCGEQNQETAKPKVVTKKIAPATPAAQPPAEAKAPEATVAEQAEATKPESAQVTPAPTVATAPAVATEPATAVPPTPAPAAAPSPMVAQKEIPPVAEEEPEAVEMPATAESPLEQPAEASGQVTAQKTLLIYNPLGKIDPFRPLLAEKPSPETATQQEITRPLTELEKLDLGQLKLTAVILPSSGSNAMAMVEEKQTSKGFVVRKGTYMGINSGQVVEILSDRIILEEQISIAGNTETRRRELTIQKPSGER